MLAKQNKQKQQKRHSKLEIKQKKKFAKYHGEYPNR